MKKQDCIQTIFLFLFTVSPVGIISFDINVCDLETGGTSILWSDPSFPLFPLAPPTMTSYDSLI